MNGSWRVFFLAIFYGSFLFSGCSSFQTREEEVAHFFEEATRLESEGDLESAIRRYEQVLVLAPIHEEARLRLAQLFFSNQQFSQAALHFKSLLNTEKEKVSPSHIRYWLSLSHFKEKRYELALEELIPLFQENQTEPYPLYPLLFQICEQNPQWSPLGLKYSQKALEDYPEESLFLKWKGIFLAQQHRILEAIQSFERVKPEDPLVLDFEKQLFQLYVKVGRYDKALQLWDLKGIPQFLWNAENQKRRVFEDLYRWVDLYHTHFPQTATAHEILSPLQQEQLVQLGTAFQNAGWVAESIEIFERILKNNPQHRFAQQQKQSAHEFLLFLKHYQNYFYTHYEEYQKKQKKRPLLTVSKDLERLIKNLKIKTLFEKFPLLSIESIMLFFNYSELRYQHPFPLSEYFEKFNHYFILFNFFGPTETNIKRIVSWLPQRQKQVWGDSYTYELFLCNASEVYHYKEYELQASFGGLCLNDHSLWLDLDTYRRIALDIYRLFLTQDYPLTPPLSQNTPISAVSAVSAVYYSSELQTKLAYRSCTELLKKLQSQAPPQHWFVQKLLEELLEVAEYHELGHLCKHQEFLPPSFWGRINPWKWYKGISFLIHQGFSEKEISIWSEEQAQLTALRHSSSPFLALYRTIASMSKSPSSSPHSAGYHRILQGYVTYLLENPHYCPSIQRHSTILEQLHLLSPEQIQEIAGILYEKK
jgi:tetratricopeptide (TPR) repeat protein